jgi:hypothetical protein
MPNRISSLAKPRWRKAIRWFCLVLGASLVVVLPMAWIGRHDLTEAYQRFRESQIPGSVDRYCTHLAAIDRIEILRLEDGIPVAGARTYKVPLYEPRDLTVVKAVTMEGAEAEALAKLWRSQRLHTEWMALCHYPHHVLRVYRGTTHVVDLVICFYCGNVALPVFPGSELVSFDPNLPQYQRLKDRMESLVGVAAHP